MPARKPTGSASSAVDESTLRVWLLALNCFAVCLLPLPGTNSHAPRSWHADPDGSSVSYVAPAEPAPAAESTPLDAVHAGLCVAEGETLPAWVVDAPHLDERSLARHLAELPSRERVRVEHFCSLYGCVSLAGD